MVCRVRRSARRLDVAAAGAAAMSEGSATMLSSHARLVLVLSSATIILLWQRLPRRNTAAMARKRRFLRQTGCSYGYRGTPAGFIDRWRRNELPGLIPPISCRRHGSEIVYLDYAGAALPTASQLAHVSEAAGAQVVCGNPHSTGPAASTGAEALERARLLVLQHFCGEHAGDWELVWTSGATAALRLAAEAFPFTESSIMAYTHSAHTSVLGMRVPATASGAKCCCIPLPALERIAAAPDEKPGSERADQADAEVSTAPAEHLLVLPAECNLTGDRPALAPLIRTVVRARGGDESVAAGNIDSTLTELGIGRGRLWVMIDGAKAAATSPLYLPDTGAAMCCVSLYKLFGEPTGLGGLLVRSDLARLLRSKGRYFGGGSVSTVLAAEDFHTPKPSIAASLTPGTLHYRGALALPAGFDSLHHLGGMEVIDAHTSSLASELVRRLKALRHADGTALIQLYGQWAECHSSSQTPVSSSPPGSEEHVAGTQAGGSRHPSGPVVAFNVRRGDGEMVGYSEVTKLAALHSPSIQLRGGCCCNPGGCQTALGLTSAQLRSAAASGKQCGDEVDMFDGHPTGVVRVSLGKDSIWEDIDELLSFIEETFVPPEATPMTVESPRASISRKSPGDADGARSDPSAQGSSSSSSARATLLGEIHVYPIKSCAAMSVDRWWVDGFGGRLMLDREWALVDGVGQVMRLERHPSLSHLRPTVQLDASTNLPTGLLLEMAGGNLPPLVLPLAVTADIDQPRSLNVCGKDCNASEFGGRVASRWLAEALGVQCRLVRYHSSARAEQPPSKSLSQKSSGVAFANEAAMLLLARSAVDALNLNLIADNQPTVGPRHFRPNIVLDGDDIHKALDGAKGGGGGPSPAPIELDIADGRLTLRITGPCTRCAMVEMDPTSGARHGAVLRTLARYHRIRSRLVFGFFCEPVASRWQNKASRSHKAEQHTDSMLELRVGDRVALSQPPAPPPSGA